MVVFIPKGPCCVLFIPLRAVAAGDVTALSVALLEDADALADAEEAEFDVGEADPELDELPESDPSSSDILLIFNFIFREESDVFGG